MRKGEISGRPGGVRDAVRRRRIRRIAAAVCALLVVSVGAVFYVRINRMYPNPRIVRADFGEAMIYENVEIEAVEAEWIGKEEALASYPDAAEDLEAPVDGRILRVKLRLRGMQEADLLLSQLVAQKGGAYAMASYELTVLANDGLQIHLQRGEERYAEVYYQFLKSQYHSKNWRRWDTLAQTLELTNTYPVRYIWELAG